MQIDVPGMLSRIELRMAELNMSKQSFYEKSGISSASFSQWNTGAYKPSVKKIKSAAKALNCTPFVRQYGILSNKWGVLLCQKEYQTNDIRRNSKNW